MRESEADDIGGRIRHRESRDKVMTAEEAALLFRDGMLVATSGSTMGYPKATFMALSERIKTQGGIKIDLLCAGPLSSEIEDVLVDAGANHVPAVEDALHYPAETIFLSSRPVSSDIQVVIYEFSVCRMIFPAAT